MKINWFSRKGGNRSENRDAAGVIDSPTVFLGIIIDGGTKGPKGAAFVKAWTTKFLNDIASQTEVTVEQVLSSMRQAQVAIRFQYPAETACYTALLLRHDIQKAWALTCGDCRLGFKTDRKELCWLTQVHTVEQFLNSPPSPSFSSLSTRHIVTRCLNSKRFSIPDIIELPYSKDGLWLLASDGYWDVFDGEISPISSEDDISLMTVGEALSCSTRDSDADNLFSSDFPINAWPPDYQEWDFGLS
jgi:serine/threonine protein phosphatase PrpC